MAEVINLNKARKAKNKSQNKLKSAENRIVYGISTKVRRVEIEKGFQESKKLDQKSIKLCDLNKKS